MTHADARTLSVFSPADIDTEINHEPRVHDAKLADFLGYAKVQDLRQLASRHREALERFGEVSTYRASKPGKGTRGGRPQEGMAFSKRQALYLCAKTDLPNGVEKTIEMVEVFDAFAAGRLDSSIPALPPPSVSPDFMLALQDEMAWLLDPGIEVRDGIVRAKPKGAERESLIAAGKRLQRLLESGGKNKTPPFCLDCAARDLWNLPQPLADHKDHPLKDGPITLSELDLLGKHRDHLRAEREAIRRETVSRMMSGFATAMEIATKGAAQ